MSIRRDVQLRIEVYKQVIQILQSDLDGQSENLKEVYEQVETDVEQKIVNAQIQVIIDMLAALCQRQAVQ